MKPIDLWRSGTSRLLLVYGGLFALWCIALIGVIQWDTRRYLSNVVDLKIDHISEYFQKIDRARLPEALAVTESLDLRDVISHGLFDAQGQLLGITTFYFAGGQNLNFAVAAEEFAKN